ncbi:nickel-responsive transcriptional regulator NikR [Polaromonas sp. SM01]|uniref:nickel-responsive transcriptional regulator NikR n=1 Tax=Polaromonas sp. SM01 TaxID=3085630 RepID=UPI002981814D|nr:nickel-responsive transcriptional regulator NikR [Polaromonas sp. SM01]MDW5444598.1 nickel-responsive transcriptional regulator NikR [Polaromonas sp. SM01]
MQRFTISLDDDLAAQFDGLIADRGYINRSEAVRDLIRERLGKDTLDARAATYCVANVSYVYDHHEQQVTRRLMALQHEHHDLVVSSLHTHLDHDHCLESVVLRGPTPAVQACAQQLVALRGVRHGQIHLVPLAQESAGHCHAHASGAGHKHLKPIS